ncbi:MAG: hypothetical protein KAS32_02780 [Candidatus Peribacteraceae bacterium]|nr:hypothetical protein [Candidatus Peribacteraceae bacterium]
MADLQTMRATIANYLANNSISSEIDLAINRAIGHYSKQRFVFNMATATMSTVKSQESYGTSDGLPSNIQKIDLVTGLINGSDLIIEPTQFTDIQYYNSRTTTIGIPYEYALYEQKMWISPIPNDAYVLTIYYVKGYDSLALDMSSNDFTTYAEDLIEGRAVWWLNSMVLDNDEGAARAKRLEQEALAELRDEYDNKYSTGALQLNASYINGC